MAAVIYTPQNNQSNKQDTNTYLEAIELGKNQAALYINELLFNATTSFKQEKKILATIKAPSLYDVARKINNGDDFISIVTTTDIKYS